MRRGLAALLLMAPRLAVACPACASGQRSTPSALYFVLMILPFVAAALAARVIVRTLRAPDDH
jgi:hypothetical protein